MPVLSAGDFGGAALSSAREIDPGQWVSDEPLLGLVREAGYLWGSVRDADGGLYSIMRRIPPVTDAGPERDGERQGLGGRLIVLGTRDASEELGADMRLRKEARHAAPSERLVRAAVPGGVRFATPAGEAVTTRLEFTPSDLGYLEDGVIEVTGTRTCPALQWYVPGAHAALLYLSQTWEVGGTLLGRPVRGFLFWEEAYMPPGGRLYVAKDPLHDARYTSWYSWATRWDDGSTEVGHFLTGDSRFGVAVTADSTGRVQAAGRVTAKIGLADDRYWHTGIDYDVDGVAWRCEPDPAGRMSGLGPMPNPQQEGRMFRADERRRPELWMAWGENVPDRVSGG
jgi:hypothetical protein